MSICDNTTVNQETPLKLQSIRKIKTCRNTCKKLLMTLELDGVPRYFIKKSTTVPVTVIKKYRGTVPRYCKPLHTYMTNNIHPQMSNYGKVDSHKRNF